MPEGCCPPFQPEAWHAKTVTWEHRKFARDRVRCFFYMPFGFGRTMQRLMGKVDQAKAQCPDMICLSDHTSKWNMDVYLGVDRDLPGVEMGELDGRYYCRVYEGPFSDTGKWCKDYAEQAAREHLAIGKQYMWYTTCPKCAKERGKNYVVVVGQVQGRNAI